MTVAVVRGAGVVDEDEDEDDNDDEEEMINGESFSRYEDDVEVGDGAGEKLEEDEEVEALEEEEEDDDDGDDAPAATGDDDAASSNIDVIEQVGADMGKDMMM
jgi:hypothetical protein